jgi:hypothetical protein
MQITIIGAGNMARSIATPALAGGHTVRIIDRAPGKAARLAAGLQENAAAADVQAAGATGTGGADIVVLALPYQAARQIAAQYADALSGKTLADISHPADVSTFDPLVVAPGTSAPSRSRPRPPRRASSRRSTPPSPAPSSPGTPAARPWTCSSPATTPPPDRPSPTWPPPAACAPSTPGPSSAPANWKASSS